MIDRRAFLALGSSAMLMPSLAGAAPTVSDLAGDIAILREALTLHPGLYRYNSPSQMSARIDRLAADFPNAPSDAARYLLLSRFLATIRCGHSYANFFNQKKAVADALFDRQTRVPFTFRWIGEMMVVTGNQSSGPGVPVGSVVRAIDGVPVADMLRQMIPLTRADGSNDGKRRALLSVTGGDAIETFDAFHGLLYGTAKPGTVNIRYRAPGKSTMQTIDLPALTLAQRRSFMKPQPDRGSTTPVWEWAMRDDGIALLTMPGWGLYNSAWNWQQWLADRLDSLKSAKGLIIDLRENEGGLDCGDAILARLIDRDLPPVGYEQRLRFQRSPAAIDRYLDTWDDSFRTLGVGAKPLPGDFFARPNGDDMLTIAPRGPRLALPVATLIGPQNSSATFQFAQRARASGKVRLYGDTTGGNRRGINGGCFFFVRLPASGLDFALPLVGYFASGQQPDRGLDPDVRVALTARDIAERRDPALNRAIAELLYV